MFELADGDEGRHEPAPDELWNESWYLDFWSEDASLGGYVRLGLYPNLGVTWFWACLVRTGEPLVTVIDNEAPLPRPPGLELRTSGLWTDVIVETPFDHMTVGLESFGVALEDPTEVYRKGWGDREALGFDLEWETDGPVFPYAVTTRYEVPCRVHGEILVGQETIEFDGYGQRDHSWGVRDWWSFDWCWNAGRLDGTAFHSFTSSDIGWSTGYVGAETIATASIEPVLGPEGLVERADLVLDDLHVDVSPQLWSPVLCVAPDGRTSRFPRALATYAAEDGRTGAGWIEFNQVQSDNR